MIFYDTDGQIKFWSWVIRTTPDRCWPFVGQLTNDGYGLFYCGKERILAHRLAYEISICPITDKSLLVCHSCDYPACCNPLHLFLGTSQDNVLDSVQKGRHSSVILKGSRRPNSILTERLIPEIRFKYSMGITQMELEKIYGIDQTTISQIVNYKTWRHV